MISLLLALSNAQAADADLTLQLKVDTPAGPVVDQAVSLPYSDEFVVDLGKSSYVVAVEAEHSGRKATVKTHVYLGADRVEVASPSLELNPEMVGKKKSTTSAPRGTKGPGGEKLELLDWQVEASWGWGAEDWVAKVSEQEVPEGHFVLVPVGAALYPSAAAKEGHRVRPSEGGPGTELLPLRVIADEGERLHVRTLGEPGGHCHAVKDSGLDGYVLDLWVDRSALVPVVNEPLDVVFSDQTKAHLDSGVAVYGPPATQRPIADAELLLEADTGVFLVPVALSAGSLSSSYASSQLREVKPTGQLVKPASGASVGTSLGGGVRVIGFDSTSIGPGFPVQETYEVDGASRAGLKLTTSCSTHEVTVPPARIKAPDGQSFVIGLVERAEAPAGPRQPLFWEDGSPAGEGLVPAGLVIANKEQQACFNLALDSTPVPEATEGVRYEADPQGLLRLCIRK